MASHVTEVSVDEHVDAAPLTVWGLVSDVTAMGRWSPETTSCRWLRGATGPTVGARFRGNNRRGWRCWWTTCTVTDAEPGRRFAFDVDFGPLPVAHWAYDFAADGDGCRATESWRDRRPGWFVRIYPVVMGVRDRAEINRANMRTTLGRLREAAEGAPGR